MIPFNKKDKMVIKQNRTHYHTTATGSRIILTISLRPSRQDATPTLSFFRPHALVSYVYNHVKVDKSKGKEKIYQPLIKATKHNFALQPIAISVYEALTFPDLNSKYIILCS